MNCEQVDELAAVYALDAVDEAERAAIEAHLETCDRHDELAELRAVALGLAAIAPEYEPSAALEARLMASIGAAPAASAATPVVLRRASRWVALAAAAVLVGAVGFAAGAVVFSGDGEPALIYVQREGGAAMRVEHLDSGGTVQVTMSGLASRPAGESYQVWAVRDPRWVSVGVCNTNDEGWWQGDFAFDAEASDEFVLTVEPAGGSTRPSGQPVLGGGSSPER